MCIHSCNPIEPPYQLKQLPLKDMLELRSHMRVGYGSVVCECVWEGGGAFYQEVGSTKEGPACIGHVCSAL